MPRKNSNRKNNRNTLSIQEIDKLIEEAKKTDLPPCFVSCSTPNCKCFTINTIDFLKFIGNEQKDVFGVILTDCNFSDDFVDVTYDSLKLCEHINEFYEETLSSLISSIKTYNKEKRNSLLEFYKNELENEAFTEVLNPNNCKLINKLNSVYREFKTLRITNNVAKFYVSILDYNDKLDECSKELMEQDYLESTNSNSKIIESLKDCCHKLLGYYILNYIIDSLNKH